MPAYRELTGLHGQVFLDSVTSYGRMLGLVNNLVGRHLRTGDEGPLAFVRHTGASTVIQIKVESDITRACELANEVAATIPFSPAEQARLAASVSDVARMLLDSPQHGYLAVAILRESEVAGVAIVVRFVGEGQGGPARSAPDKKLEGRLPGQRIEEIGSDFDRIEKSETGGDLLVTLVQWKRAGDRQDSACAGGNPIDS